MEAILAEQELKRRKTVYLSHDDEEALAALMDGRNHHPALTRRTECAICTEAVRRGLAQLMRGMVRVGE